MVEIVTIPLFRPDSDEQSLNLEQLGNLHNWLNSGQNRASMQEIKKALPWQKADREIEDFISQSLIERDRGSYRSLISEITIERLTELKTEATNLTTKINVSLQRESLITKTESWLMSLAVVQLREQQTSRIIGLPKSSVIPVLASYKQSGPYLFIDVDSQNAGPVGLASYFSGAKVSLKSQQVLAQLGDVNPAYFLEMAGKQLHLISDGQQPRSRRGNIFVEALQAFGYLTQHQSIALTQPLLSIEESVLATSCLAIKKSITDIFIAHQQLNDVEQDVLEALVYNQLLLAQEGTRNLINITF